MVQLAVLLTAAFVGGTVNAIAGGGSFLTFPGLLAAGYPAQVANVTSTVALWPGYVGGSFAYLPELRSQRRRVIAMVPAAVLGAAAGATVLLATPAAWFEAAVPFLILFAAGVLACQSRLGNRLANRLSAGTDSARGVPRSILSVATFCLAAYGAYFGAGLGVLTLGMFGLILPDDLQRLNALKATLSSLANAVGALAFAVFGPVAWEPALVMAVAAAAGGYVGGGFASRLKPDHLRAAVVAYGTVAALILLIR